MLNLGEDLASVADFARHGRSDDHDWAHEESPTGGAALAAFKVTIRAGGTDFVAHKLIWVHPETHGAAGFPPIEAGFTKDFIKAHLRANFADALGAGHGDGTDARSDFAALEEFGGFDKVRHPRVGAGAEKGDLDLLAGQFLPRLELHKFERLLGGGSIGFRELLG